MVCLFNFVLYFINRANLNQIVLMLLKGNQCINITFFDAILPVRYRESTRIEKYISIENEYDDN